MLANPAPADWPMWRRTLNNWGYSPLDEIDTRNVAQLKLVWTRPLGDGGYQEGTPLVHDGILFFPNPGRRHSSVERRDRRLHLGASAHGARGRRRVLPGGRDQPQPRDLRQLDSRQRRGRLCLRAERAHRRARLGNAHPRLPDRREEQLGPDHRQRQGHLGPQLRARGRPRGLRHHGVRREDRPASCGARARSRSPASPATKAGATFRTRSAGTSACGWCRASIRS